MKKNRRERKYELQFSLGRSFFIPFYATTADNWAIQVN